MKKIIKTLMILVLLAFIWVGSLMLEGAKQPDPYLIVLGTIAMILFGIMIVLQRKL